MRSFTLPAVVLACATLSAQTSTPSDSALSLDQALSLALANNKDIAAARLERPVDLANVDVAHERLNPDLDYEGARDTPRDYIGLSFPIELGGKRGARTAVAQAAVATGEARLEQVIATVSDDVRRTYIDLAVAQRKIAITEEVANLYLRARDAAHERFLAGTGPRRDDVASQADLLTAQADVLEAHGEADAARATLNVLIGRAPALPVTAILSGESALLPLDSAIARASTANTDLKVLDGQIREQTARISVARAAQKPDLTAAGGVTFDAEPDFAVGWRIDLGVTVPLFTTHRAGVTFETATLTQLRAEREALLAEVTAAIASALARADSAAARSRSYTQDILPLAQQEEAFAQDSYQSGQTGLDSLILALQHARERRLAGLQAAEDFQTALADLERAISGPIR